MLCICMYTFTNVVYPTYQLVVQHVVGVHCSSVPHGVSLGQPTVLFIVPALDLPCDHSMKVSLFGRMVHDLI